MPRKAIYFIVACMSISLALTGCAKKEKTAEKKAASGKEAVSSKQPVPSDKPITEERIIFSFEKDLQGWEIPEWVLDKKDHVGKDMEISKDVAYEGKSSLKIDCDFPGKTWTAVLIELEQYLDFSPYREIAMDIYTPEDTPLGLRGRMILTVGEGWKFTEMTRAIPLVPGEWTTIKASIEPGSYDWKRTVPDESFRADIRKIAVRIESNKKPVYKGPVYIDSVRIGK
jgi:hypothetical protein